MTEQVIGRTGRPAAGWVAELWLIDIAHVLDVPTAEDSLVGEDGFPLSLDAQATKINFAFRTCSYQETSADSADGTIFSLGIETVVSGQDGDLLDWATANLRRRWLAVWRDSNNWGYAAGDAGNGLRLSLERNVGGQNFCRLKLSGRSWHTAWRLADGDLDTLLPYTQIVYDSLTDTI